MTIIFVGCVSYTETDLSPSSGRVVEPLDTSLQRRIIILARAIEISNRFAVIARQCPGNVRAIYFPLKIIILTRVPEAGPRAVNCCTKNELAPSSGRLGRAVDTCFHRGMTVFHHTIDSGGPGGDPEALGPNVYL